MTEIRFPSMNLEGKVPIVTGGGQGLRLWMAQGLAHAGADIPLFHYPMIPFFLILCALGDLGG